MAMQHSRTVFVDTGWMRQQMQYDLAQVTSMANSIHVHRFA
ncbi:hypothetical protein U5801_27485 [Lamprobacter modestohalophilus]|nr:hypothetical protein [Lamprobacter modestohalophilus]MEA1053518.1 hypothetical protein [Lamprobacter modestohalophilus]